MLRNIHQYWRSFFFQILLLLLLFFIYFFNRLFLIFDRLAKRGESRQMKSDWRSFFFQILLLLYFFIFIFFNRLFLIFDRLAKRGESRQIKSDNALYTESIPGGSCKTGSCSTDTRVKHDPLRSNMIQWVRWASKHVCTPIILYIFNVEHNWSGILTACHGVCIELST